MLQVGVRLKSVNAEVVTLNKRLNVLVKEAEQREKLMRGLRLDKTDMLKKSNQLHRENETKRSRQMMELKKEIASKDEQISQYRRHKLNLEAILVKRVSNDELEQHEQLVNQVDGMIIFDSRVNRLSSHEESEMPFSHRKFKTEEIGCDQLSLIRRTNENLNMNITMANVIHNPISTNQNSLQHSSMLIGNSLKLNRVIDRTDENVVDI